MRTRKLLMLLPAGVLLLGAVQVAGLPHATAQPFGYAKLTPAQKRHVSGLLATELGGVGQGGQRQASTAQPSSRQVPPPACGGQTGSNVKVSQNCLNIADPDIQGRSQGQNETWVSADPVNPRHLLAGYNDYRRGDSTCGVSYSTDGGGSWADSTLPDGFVRGTAYGGAPREYFQFSGDPSTAWDSRGNAYFACLESNRGASATANPDQSSGIYVYRSTGTDGASWNFTGRPVAEHNDVAGAGNFLNDKPLMTVDDSTSSAYRDRIYVTWTVFAADGTAYIDEVHSSDYGEHFSAPVVVSTDSALCQRPVSATHPLGRCDNNQFSDPFTAPDGSLYVVWDNYNNAVSGSDNHNQVLLARSTDGGATFSAPVKVGDFYDLPDCATYQGGADPGVACVPEKGATHDSIFRAANYPYGAVDPKNPGTVAVSYASYINRYSSEQNGCAPAGFSSATGLNLYAGVKTPGACHNGIVLSVSRDSGATFTGTGSDVRTLPVAAGTAGQRSSDQFFQGMGFTQSGELAVSFYDRSYGTDETTGFSDMSLANSTDLASFRSERVTSSSMPPETEFSGDFYGDYTQLAVTPWAAYPLWSDTRQDDLFLCPGTGTPGNPPKLCTGSAPNAAVANNEAVYTAGAPLG